MWKKHIGGVSWKLSKLDHLLLGCSRMMFLLFKFTSKVPNNAKQLGRTATTQQGLKWLLMWIRLHYPVSGRRGVDTERWCYVSAKDNALNATLQQWEGICLINFQRFLLSVYLKAILLKTPKCGVFTSRLQPWTNVLKYQVSLASCCLPLHVLEYFFHFLSLYCCTKFHSYCIKAATTGYGWAIFLLKQVYQMF